MNIVNSTEPLENVVYKIGTDGMANVWIRFEKPDFETAGYVGEEVYFRVTPSTVSENEIRADPGFFFEALRDAAPGAVADHLQLETVRKAKRDLISSMCQAAIFAGIDVELGGGIIQHFSLAETDQINLFGKMAQLQAGAERLEYHGDGSPCRFYSAADMEKICTEAMKHVSTMTTICNSLFVWLADCKTQTEVCDVNWYADIPEKYRSEVLKAYLLVEG